MLYIVVCAKCSFLCCIKWIVLIECVLLLMQVSYPVYSLYIWLCPAAGSWYFEQYCYQGMSLCSADGNYCVTNINEMETSKSSATYIRCSHRHRLFVNDCGATFPCPSPSSPGPSCSLFSFSPPSLLSPISFSPVLSPVSPLPLSLCLKSSQWVWGVLVRAEPGCQMLLLHLGLKSTHLLSLA